MRKKLVVLMLVVVALLLIAGPALAAGSGRTTYAAKQGVKRVPQVISLTGTFEGYTTDPEGISVHIRMTNRAFIGYRDATVTVTMDDSYTKYYFWKNRKERLTLSNFAQVTQYLNDGYHLLSINALRTSDPYVFKARRVEVNKPRT